MSLYVWLTLNWTDVTTKLQFKVLFVLIEMENLVVVFTNFATDLNVNHGYTHDISVNNNKTEQLISTDFKLHNLDGVCL